MSDLPNLVNQTRILKCDNLEEAIQRFKLALALFKGNARMSACGVWRDSDHNPVFLIVSKATCLAFDNESVTCVIDSERMRIWPMAGIELHIYATLE